MASRTVYSIDLFTGSLAVGTTFTYDFDPSYAYVIRNFTCVIQPGSLSRSQVALEWDGIPLIVMEAAPPRTDTLEWEGRIVLPGTNTLTVQHFNQDPTAIANVAVSGYGLLLP